MTGTDTTRSDASREVATGIRFDGWPGWTLLGAFVVLNLVIAVLAGGPAMRDGHGFAALLLLTGAAALAVLSGQYPLELSRVLTIVALIVGCTLLMLDQVLTSGPAGFLNWNYNASNFILFAVALRGRIGWAWIGLGAVTLITMTWSLVATHSLVQGFYLTYGQVGALLAGTFFAVVLRTAATRVLTLQALRRQLVADDHLRAETERERADQLGKVRRRVIPVLTAITNGAVSPTQRHEYLLLEAVLRDEIRGARLAVEPLATAVRAARSRGNDVVLLDDADETRLEWDDLEWVADVIAEIDQDRITVRLSGDPAVITVATVDGNVRQHQIPTR